MQLTDKNFLWQEKYRPSSIKTMVLPAKIKRTIQSCLNNKTIPHFIFFSRSPGTGKTSLSKVIVNELGAEHLYINVSKDGNIDTLRTKITKFASVKAFTSNGKIIILDEMEGSSRAFQEALKADIEEFSDSCRFIMTTNNINRIIEPLKSRCTVLEFDMDKKEIREEIIPKMNKLLSAILKSEKVSFSDEDLNKIIEARFPDIRDMITFLQEQYITHNEIRSDMVSNALTHNDFYNLLLNKKITDARKYLLDNGVSYDEMYSNLFRNFVPLIDPNNKAAKAEVIILIANYMNQHTTSIDKEITFTALMYEIVSVLSR